MAIKTIGVIILMLTALYYSSSHQKTEQYKLTVLTELCTLFSHISKNIECFSKPIGEICREYTSPLLAQYDFYTYWQEKGLREAIRKIPHISDTVRDTLSRYAESAGHGYKDDELRLCRYMQEHLEEELKRQKEENLSKNKLYRTLPFLLVLSIVLLLY